LQHKVECLVEIWISCSHLGFSWLETLWWTNQWRKNRREIWHICGKRKINTGLWWGTRWTEEYATWRIFRWKDTKMDLIWTG